MTKTTKCHKIHILQLREKWKGNAKSVCRTGSPAKVNRHSPLVHRSPLWRLSCHVYCITNCSARAKRL